MKLLFEFEIVLMELKKNAGLYIQEGNYVVVWLCKKNKIWLNQREAELNSAIFESE